MSSLRSLRADLISLSLFLQLYSATNAFEELFGRPPARSLARLRQKRQRNRSTQSNCQQEGKCNDCADSNRSDRMCRPVEHNANDTDVNLVCATLSMCQLDEQRKKRFQSLRANDSDLWSFTLFAAYLHPNRFGWANLNIINKNDKRATSVCLFEPCSSRPIRSD